MLLRPNICEILFLHTAAPTDARIEPALQDKLLRRLLAVVHAQNLNLFAAHLLHNAQDCARTAATYLFFPHRQHAAAGWSSRVPFNRQQMADYLNLDRSALSKSCANAGRRFAGI